MPIHGALKYEIAIDVCASKVIWISGPHKVGVHHTTIFTEKGLKAKIPQGKKVISVCIYGSKAEPHDHEKLALPNLCDRSRHESFKSRLKCFPLLADTYHHDLEKYVLVFEAVAVIVQY
jgi:hypothetical protein